LPPNTASVLPFGCGSLTGFGFSWGGIRIVLGALGNPVCGTWHGGGSALMAAASGSILYGGR
jgi:hypothetical protein